MGSGDEWIRLGALKGHIDGIMGTSSARFFEPYSHDAKNRGRWRPLMVNDKGEFVEGKFLGYMLDADRAGLQLTVHAIGDEANNVLLNYLDELNKQNGKRDRRFRLVHAQVLAPRRFQTPGPTRRRCRSATFSLERRHALDGRAYRLRENQRRVCFQEHSGERRCVEFWHRLAGNVGFGVSDQPDARTLRGRDATNVTGQPAAGWFPNERITIEEAISAYTYNTAYANFEEKIKGSIEVGKLADLTVLSKNLLKVAAKRISNNQVLYTIVDGKIVYESYPNP